MSFPLSQWNVRSLSPTVDLKYITSRQVLSVEYENATRQFLVHRVSANPPENNSHDVASELHAISLSDPSPWTVGWDTSVSVDTAVQNQVFAMNPY